MCHLAREASYFLLALSLVSCGNGGRPELLAATDRSEIFAVAAEAKDAIVRGDATELLKYISSAEGLSCTDTAYSYGEVSRFLNDKGSHLSVSLFDTGRFRRECGEGYSPDYPAISEKEFFQAVVNQPVVREIDKDWAAVIYVSPAKNHYPREWYLHREDRTWKIGGSSFVVGACACG